MSGKKVIVDPSAILDLKRVVDNNPVLLSDVIDLNIPRIYGIGVQFLSFAGEDE